MEFDWFKLENAAYLSLSFETVGANGCKVLENEPKSLFVFEDVVGMVFVVMVLVVAVVTDKNCPKSEDGVCVVILLLKSPKSFEFEAADENCAKPDDEVGEMESENPPKSLVFTLDVVLVGDENCPKSDDG